MQTVAIGITFPHDWGEDHKRIVWEEMIRKLQEHWPQLEIYKAGSTH